ncbi:hypothetical protein [uncultured Ruegeria sp.]|uniref:hypothetical protein n=1 Tax=uncultured Ruegeria sp. TaxID=259304 RepID=UPI0026108450|nr:hypothetical protein [uncultured Ruegeria sp.]
MGSALIVDSVVLQLDLTGVALTDAQKAAGWKAVDDGVAPGMIEQGDGSFVAPVPDLEAARSIASLSRYDFASAAAKAGYVTWPEAAQWAAGNSLPAQVQSIIDALPAEGQGPAMMDALARPEIRRNGDLMPALATAFATNDAGLDAIFGITA